MRAEGWEALLHDHIADAYRSRFAWGKRDCALWASDWVHKATGTDFGAAWRGRYKTETGAAKLMRKRGLTGVAAIADAHLPSCPVTLAQRGDVVLLPQGSLGICNGRHSFFLTADSVLSCETLDCLKAWRVE